MVIVTVVIAVVAVIVTVVISWYKFKHHDEAVNINFSVKNNEASSLADVLKVFEVSIDYAVTEKVLNNVSCSIYITI